MNCSTADANNYPQFNFGVGDWYSDPWGNSSGLIYYESGNTFSVTHGDLAILVPANLNSFWEVEAQLQSQYPGWSIAFLDDYYKLNDLGLLNNSSQTSSVFGDFYIGNYNIYNPNIFRYNNSFNYGSLVSYNFISTDQNHVRLVKKNVSPSLSYEYY